MDSTKLRLVEYDICLREAVLNLRISKVEFALLIQQ